MIFTGLSQKIDPKVRAERRKKFFGIGRRKREIGNYEKGKGSKKK